MKTKALFSALLMGAVIVACSPKAAEGEPEVTSWEDGEEVAKTSAEVNPSKAVIDSVSYLMGINFGSFLKGYEFGELNYSQMVKGMKDYMKAKGDMRDPSFADQFKISPDLMNDLFNKYLEARHEFVALLNQEEGDVFLKNNLKKEGVEVTESGLQYKVIEAGSEVKAGAQDTVSVLYSGRLLDGTVFDETKEGDEPRTFAVNQVIKGWTEGLQLIGEGGKIELYIPGSLAYGERGNYNIPANSTLIFSVEIVKVTPCANPEEAPAENAPAE